MWAVKTAKMSTALNTAVTKYGVRSYAKGPACMLAKNRSNFSSKSKLQIDTSNDFIMSPLVSSTAVRFNSNFNIPPKDTPPQKTASTMTPNAPPPSPSPPPPSTSTPSAAGSFNSANVLENKTAPIMQDLQKDHEVVQKSSHAAGELPDKEVLEKYFFRTVAFVWDLSYISFIWARQNFEKYVVQNKTVQDYWKTFMDKMDKAKKD